ncbi:MAG: type II toxin-antitoxin system RelE/ParE family toxin [Candidatus Nealsonbacteria bacterium]|nr:type II toxin-antitoxin system RelE/ParE family toxin [Candidatus Nealsonbacteria bacterium]
MRYEIEITSAAQRDLRSLPRDVLRRVDAKILGLAVDPRPPDSRLLRGQERLYRVRVGNYRIIYRVEDDRMVVLVVRVRHRREVYR